MSSEYGTLTGSLTGSDGNVSRLGQRLEVVYKYQSRCQSYSTPLSGYRLTARP